MSAEPILLCRTADSLYWAGRYLERAESLARLITGARVARIAPVSREMILNFVSHSSLGLPKSY